MSRFLLPLAISLLPALLPHKALADVYKYVDGAGHVYYTDRPKHSGFVMIMQTPPAFIYSATDSGGVRTLGNRVGRRGGRTNSVYHAQKRMEYAPLINSVANKYNLDPELLHAVIRAESGYNPGAVSNKGAAGMMQLMPATAYRFGVRDRFDPVDNIEGGARYLSELIDMFPYNLKLAVAAYNSGENTVKRYGNQVPPIAETQNYVERVLGYYNR